MTVTSPRARTKHAVEASTPPLAGFPVFSVASIDRLEESLGTLFGARIAEAVRSDSPIRAAGYRARGLQSDLWFCDYSAEIQVDFPDGDYLRVQLPIGSGAETRTSGKSIEIGRRRGCISRAAAELRFGGGFRQFAWRVSDALLIRKLTALTGEPADRIPRLAPAIDLEGGSGAALLAMTACLAQCLEAPDSPGKTIQTAELEQAMLTTLLMSDPALLAPATGKLAAPRQVRVVESFIEAHWHEPLEIEQIARLTGVSARTMQRTFRHFRGYSPMEFLKKVRLREAMALIATAGPAARVTEIAYTCGYTSLSAFSRDFSRAYGRAPSVFLKA